MICPSCRQDFWALFVCEDRVYRCRACRDKQPKLVSTATLQRPYITRYAKADARRESRESVAKSRRARNLCIKCGDKAQEYSPGNFSVQCAACNEEKASKRRREQ